MIIDIKISGNTEFAEIIFGEGIKFNNCTVRIETNKPDLMILLTHLIPKGMLKDRMQRSINNCIINVKEVCVDGDVTRKSLRNSIRKINEALDTVKIKIENIEY